LASFGVGSGSPWCSPASTVAASVTSVVAGESARFMPVEEALLSLSSIHRAWTVLGAGLLATEESTAESTAELAG